MLKVIKTMSGITTFIHCHLFRKLYDSQITPTEKKNVTLKDIIDYHNNKPDIETGLNKQFIIQTQTQTKPETQSQFKKGPQYWV